MNTIVLITKADPLSTAGANTALALSEQESGGPTAPILPSSRQRIGGAPSRKTQRNSEKFSEYADVIENTEKDRE